MGFLEPPIPSTKAHGCNQPCAFVFGERLTLSWKSSRTEKPRFIWERHDHCCPDGAVTAPML